MNRLIESAWIRTVDQGMIQYRDSDTNRFIDQHTDQDSFSFGGFIYDL